MNNNFDRTNYKNNFKASLPKPLDEPLKLLPDYPIYMKSLYFKINEIIERQNALIEIIEKLLVK